MTAFPTMNGVQSKNGLRSSSSILEELGDKINKNSSTVSAWIASNNLPQPSFESNGPSSVLPDDAPQQVHDARQDLISAALEMLHVAIGPSEFVPNLALGFQYAACVQWLCQYDVFRRIPQPGFISYAELAVAAAVPEQRLKSIVRMSLTSGLFREHPDGIAVGHSATSALLASNDDVHAWAEYICARSAPMALSMTAAHQRWGADTQAKNETAYNVANRTDLPFFDHLATDDSRVKEFAAYMKSVTTGSGVDRQHLKSGYAWKDVREGGLVVDVGGSTGATAVMLASGYPHLRFIVQDLLANVESGRQAAAGVVPEPVLSRIDFQAHDFNQPQPVKGADVYLLRMILHDWPDKEALAILRNIVSAMSPAASTLLIMDTVLPKPGSVPISTERIMRVRDLSMMQAFNSRERDLDEWNALLTAADARLDLVDVTQPFRSNMSVLRVRLRSCSTT